ncbi:MAG: alpha-ketoglutarate-dependent dioxygenase AlkB [Opitutales bacterium]|jgi:alkylated DNA repair dioxygenase AlkB|tara:strand:+ start:1023 stop:1643 length:621 start_codon:yes stop_codon:yes gene_type:complete
MTNTQGILFEEGEVNYDLPDAEIRYFPTFFTPSKADFLLDQLLRTIEWKQNTIKMYGKENPVPRLEAWYGDKGKSYAYSGIKMEPRPWTDDLLFIKKSIEAKAGVIFNSVLINYYRNGQDRVAWHSDDEKELGRNPIIASVSLGAERNFKLRHKHYKSNDQKEQIILNHGSFLLMEGTTQHNWMHEIPRTAKPIGPRINLTFRIIK